MPRTTTDNDWDENEWQPDEEDDDDTTPCPHCAKMIYDGAEQCPYCGNYISEEDAPRAMKPLWMIIGGVVCLAIVVLWIWQG